MRNIITIILVLVIGFFASSYLSKNNMNPITSTQVKGTIDKLSAMSVKDTMDFMTGDLATKAGTEFDREYLKAMILNHKAEIAMAKLANVTSAHAEVKTMAKEIIRVQSIELAQLEMWQKEWFPGE